MGDWLSEHLEQRQRDSERQQAYYEGYDQGVQDTQYPHSPGPYIPPKRLVLAGFTSLGVMIIALIVIFALCSLSLLIGLVILSNAVHIPVPG